jgi:hypothetical protein
MYVPTWHQNPMRDCPIVFVRVRSEQAIANPVSDLFQASSDQFREALLVVDFVRECLGGNVELVDAAEIQLEYLA